MQSANVVVVVVVMRLRGVQRSKPEGWGDGIIDTQRMRIRRPHENSKAAFSDFSTLRPGFKKVRF